MSRKLGTHPGPAGGHEKAAWTARYLARQGDVQHKQEMARPCYISGLWLRRMMELKQNSGYEAVTVPKTLYSKVQAGYNNHKSKGGDIYERCKQAWSSRPLGPSPSPTTPTK